MESKRTRIAIVLVAGYITCQLVADITAVKIVGPVLGQFVPAAVFIYAITFTWRDLIHRHLGKRAAVTVVWTAAIANVAMALYLALTVAMPAAPFWQGQEAYELILGVVPRIVVASIVAEVVSELIDTEVYHRMEQRQPWLRVLTSNAIALPIDSFIFVTLAFYGTMPTNAMLEIVQGQIIIKALITVVSLPLIYAVRSRNSDNG
jgi:uncharacterized integral membrane protein (TIGR00697 family)